MNWLSAGRLLMTGSRFFGPWGLAILGIAGAAALISSASKGTLGETLNGKHSPLRMFQDNFQSSEPQRNASPERSN